MTTRRTNVRGIIIKDGKLLVTKFRQEDDGKKEHLELSFHIKNTADYEAINLGDTSHGLLELTRHEFADPKADLVLPAFLGKVDIQTHIDSNAPTFV